MFKPNTSHINMRSSFLLIALLLLPMAATANNVLIETPLGNIEIEMLEDDAPNTVAKFLEYVNGGNYADSFIHRLEPGFVMQGGGFFWTEDNRAGNVPYSGTIANEFKVSNTRGTVAMAREDDPDSATSQWFINLDDNLHLDTLNGGFTVFARVVSGMDVVDAINEMETYYDSPSFSNLPLIDYTEGEAYVRENFVITTMTDLGAPPQPFVMNPGLNDAWYEPATSGQGFFITVLPTMGKVIASWFTFDTELAPEDAPGNLAGAGQRWMQAIGDIDGNTAVLTNHITTGGLFDEPGTVTTTEDGTITLTFEDCSTGTVEYDIPSIDRQGSIAIERVANDNIELCEALYEAQ